MKNKLTVLLLFVATLQTIAQNKQPKDPYIPVLADTLYWWEVWKPEFENFQVDHFYTVEKQMYNDTLYHKLS